MLLEILLLDVGQLLPFKDQVRAGDGYDHNYNPDAWTCARSFQIADIPNFQFNHGWTKSMGGKRGRKSDLPTIRTTVP
jgi:hypothetical protein